MTDRRHHPVALFCYARPDHLIRTLEALAGAEGASHTSLFIFSDGAKSPHSVEAVDAVRRIIADPKWRTRFAGIEIVEARLNKGLARSIVDGVSMVLEKAPGVIVLEDDLVVSSDFLNFMNDCLLFYEGDRSVGSVTGYSPIRKLPKAYAHDVMMVPRGCSHGWATWPDRWRSVEWSHEAAAKIWWDPKLRNGLNSTGTDQLYRLQRQIEGKIDTWAILFNVWQVMNDKLTVYPAQNRVSNYGFDGTGMNTQRGDGAVFFAGANDACYQLSRPTSDPRILSEFRRLFSGRLAGQIKRAILNLRTPRPSNGRVIAASFRTDEGAPSRG